MNRNKPPRARLMPGAVVLAAGLALAACAHEHPAPVAPQPAMAGGWSPVATSDAQVVAAAAAAMAQLPDGQAALARIDAAERQVVSGTNLHLLLSLADGRRWDVTVWHRLDGGYELTTASPAAPHP